MAGTAAQIRTIEHPLVEDSLVRLRDKDTDTDTFRRHARLLTLVLALHVLGDLPLRKIRVESPLEPVDGALIDRGVIFVPVLRAGLAMLDAMSGFVPGSKVGFVGLERDEETAIAHSYYEKLPAQLADAETVILDPMLATGGSALAAIESLLRHNATSIRLACIVAAPEGIDAVHSRHPTVPIFTAAIDRALNERKFILPGLGDFGDRYFGTV
jgi:uracil phosphoribosyltransferase